MKKKFVHPVFEYDSMLYARCLPQGIGQKLICVFAVLRFWRTILFPNPKRTRCGHGTCLHRFAQPCKLVGSKCAMQRANGNRKLRVPISQSL